MVTVSDDAGMAFDAMNCRLGRGISFGNALDTLREGDAGFRLQERYFAEVRAAGFDTVRLPVKWSAHAGSPRLARSARRFSSGSTGQSARHWTGA
jgi:hypothetical protein